MRYILTSLLVLFLLTGCGPKNIKCEPTIIKVAVATPAPVPPETVRPSASIFNNSTEDSAKAKDIAATIEMLKSYVLELEGYLDVYRTKAIENNKNINKVD